VLPLLLEPSPLATIHCVVSKSLATFRTLAPLDRNSRIQLAGISAEQVSQHAFQSFAPLSCASLSRRETTMDGMKQH
jgi:hypothetical protein